MKTLILFFSIFLTSLIISCSTKDVTTPNNPNNNQKNMGNPAACYCAMMGYEYITEIDSSVGEIGYCILPNGEKVDAWAFFRGEVAQEYSYCAKKGYSLIIDTISNDAGFKSPCPFCIKKDSLGNIETKINMEELMRQNGDTCETPEGRKGG